MIRKAKAKDIFEIEKLINSGAKQAKVLRRSAEEIAVVIDSFFVDEEDGEIVGCCSLEVYSPKLAEIRSLVVDKNFQGLGIGTKLIQHCIVEAKKQDIYEILSITDQITLFEKQGFSNQLNNQSPLFIKLKNR